jgi:Helix-turn-helix domain
MLTEKGFTDNWLQPTGAQERLLRQYAGCKRFVWNRALSIEQARYCRGEKMVGCTQRMRELTMWRNNPDPQRSRNPSKGRHNVSHLSRESPKL